MIITGAKSELIIQTNKLKEELKVGRFQGYGENGNFKLS